MLLGYHIGTLVCLALMAVHFVVIVVQLFVKKGEEKKLYIRDFRAGKGILIYLYTIPLFCMGRWYAGETFLNGLFNGISPVVELVLLQYHIEPVADLMAASTLFSVTVYISFALIAFNALFFVVSLAGQQFWNALKRIQFALSKKPKVILFGNNEQNCHLYDSDKAHLKLVVDDDKTKDVEELYMQSVAYVQTLSFTKYVNRLVKVFLKSKLTVVINTGDEEKNLFLSRCFIDAIASLKEEEKKKCFGRLRIFVFGSPDYQAVYEDVVSDGFGCVTYVNAYQIVATDFIEKYPLTQFMDEDQIDYSTSLVKEGVDINVLMVGFGKTNRQVFLTSVANNQFICKSDGQVRLKKVKYYIFDKDVADENKNLNHNYYRFRNEVTTENGYLPLPEMPAEEEYLHLDVNSTEFYRKVKSVLTRSASDANYIIIAFGSDLENIDMAQKLAAKRKEWGVPFVPIFVKTRKRHEGEHLLEEENCYVIGCEEEVVYDLPTLLGDDIFQMAQLRNETYDIEYELSVAHEKQGKTQLSQAEIDAIKTQAYYNWYHKKSQLERDSSLYCCLSLRSKLQMMGLDYCKKEADDSIALSEEEYLAIYAGEDMPDRESLGLQIDGKPVVKYTLSFPDSRRKDMAAHEHFRWNSYMISSGFIPATKEEIEHETIMVNGKVKKTNGKRYDLRRHGNLTTFEGLVDFRRMVAERDGAKEEDVDVIKYDYQLLDDAYWLLDKTGNKIIRRR